MSLRWTREAHNGGMKCSAKGTTPAVKKPKTFKNKWKMYWKTILSMYIFLRSKLKNIWKHLKNKIKSNNYTPSLISSVALSM